MMRVRQGLSAAVERQMVADVPVGAFLSGGLDSSAIVALASQRASDLSCFTIEPVGGSDDDVVEDLPYAVKVAEHLGVDLEIVKIDSNNLANDLVEMVWQLDEPLADPAPLNVLYISRLAKERGIKVLLSGSGGDDLFTGYRRHLALRYEGLWSWLPPIARQGLERFSINLDTRIPHMMTQVRANYLIHVRSPLLASTTPPTAPLSASRAYAGHGEAAILRILMTSEIDPAHCVPQSPSWS